MEVTINKQTKLSQHLTLSSAAALSHSSEFDGVRLTPHFTLGELTKTNTRIKNVPNEAQVENLKRLCGWLEMLRSEWNKRMEASPPTPLQKERGTLRERGVGAMRSRLLSIVGIALRL